LKGWIFDIQRYAIHDGPGIRTIVFLKGCLLRCAWCCNPESQSFTYDLQFRKAICQQCGSCVKACHLQAVHPDLGVDEMFKIDRQRCDLCGDCVQSCPHEALTLIGEQMAVEDVLKAVSRDMDIYRRSGGGVTLSGGEPLAQPGFSAAILQACHDSNIHTAVETTGCVQWTVFERILPFTDLFLYDLKHADSRVHLVGTKSGNELILKNLQRLHDIGAQIMLRIPLIPGFNTDQVSLVQLAKLASSLRLNEVHIMPFHQFGKGKYQRLGRNYSMAEQPGLRESPARDEILLRAKEYFSDYGLQAIVGG